jgi:hypothetical protein
VLTIVAMLSLMFYRRSQYSGAQVAETASAPPLVGWKQGS